jgi:hypothetical protein
LKLIMMTRVSEDDVLRKEFGDIVVAFASKWQSAASDIESAFTPNSSGIMSKGIYDEE